MPTLLTPPTLEVVLQGLHDSEIRCGIQNELPAGGIDEANADGAIAYAVERNWLIAEGNPPHSSCFTESGRTLFDRR